MSIVIDFEVQENTQSNSKQRRKKTDGHAPSPERLKHLVALCRCAVDFMELESKSLQEFEETPLLVFYLLAKAAGIRFPEGWIEQRLFQTKEAPC